MAFKLSIDAETPKHRILSIDAETPKRRKRRITLSAEWRRNAECAESRRTDERALSKWAPSDANAEWRQNAERAETPNAPNAKHYCFWL